MARIAGVNLPLNKRVEIGLTYIYGVGRPTSNKLLDTTKISPDTYVRDLTEEEVCKLRDTIVLLNDVLMCAWPIGMFFLVLRRPRAGRLGAGITSYRPSSCRRPASAGGPCARPRRP